MWIRERENPCCHGWPVNHRLFEYQFDQLLKYGYRCIGMDLRGFGKSSRPWSGYTYDRAALSGGGVVSKMFLLPISHSLRVVTCRVTAAFVPKDQPPVALERDSSWASPE